MRRIVVILALSLFCLALHRIVPEEGFDRCGTGCESIVDDYMQQLVCQHRCNQSADTVLRITVPSCSVSYPFLRHGAWRVLRMAAEDTAAAAFVPEYPEWLMPPRHVFGSKAVEYYLYALCRMRI